MGLGILRKNGQVVLGLPWSPLELTIYYLKWKERNALHTLQGYVGGKTSFLVANNK